MKRYLAIWGKWYYPNNGLHDPHSFHDSIHAAQSAAYAPLVADDADWSQVWDLQEDKCVTSFVQAVDEATGNFIGHAVHNNVKCFSDTYT